MVLSAKQYWGVWAYLARPDVIAWQRNHESNIEQPKSSSHVLAGCPEMKAMIFRMPPWTVVVELFHRTHYITHSSDGPLPVTVELNPPRCKVCRTFTLWIPRSLTFNPAAQAEERMTRRTKRLALLTKLSRIREARPPQRSYQPPDFQVTSISSSFLRFILQGSNTPCSHGEL